MIRLEQASYEKLIRQLIYIDENINEIAAQAEAARFFSTGKRAKWFFEEYIGRVESLFRETEIAEKGGEKDVYINSLPFIVLDSIFTLIDAKKRIRLCHMTHDPLSESKKSAIEIYFLSEAGCALLMKRTGEKALMDIGKGFLKYKVNSIYMD